MDIIHINNVHLKYDQELLNSIVSQNFKMLTTVIGKSYERIFQISF